MCIRKLCYLVCTNCNNQFANSLGDHYAETAREIRGNAKEHGWRYVRVENGSMWDFCPRCYERFRAAQQATCCPTINGPV